MSETLRSVTDARHVFAAAVRAVQAPALLAHLDLETLAGRPLRLFRRIVIVGAGKASMALAGALEDHLGSSLAERTMGSVVVPDGYPASYPEDLPRPVRVAVREGGHPFPTVGSVREATRALALAADAGPDDLVVALISGGGSALWALPPAAVTLADVQTTVALLVRSGLKIEHINTVRKHISGIAGGRLALAASPARLVALVLSDVVGDVLSTVASGPTVPDPTTFCDALDVLRGADLIRRTPASVLEYLSAGAARQVHDTPDHSDPAFRAATTSLLGSNATALDAAARQAERLGYTVYQLDREVVGEAREVGARVVQRALAASAGGPMCWLWGGETTVTVAGPGRGGRNQEVALAAALALAGARADLVVLSGGTDGVDGPTDAAGGWASPDTARLIRERGRNPELDLDANDAYGALHAASALIHTGPTHTNVADVGVVLRR